MRRLIPLALAVVLPAGEVQAQGVGADVAQAFVLVGEANQRVKELEARLDAVTLALDEWEDALLRAGDGSGEARAEDELRRRIANHPTALAASPRCRAAFEEVGMGREIRDPNALLDCTSLQASVAHPSELECANLNWRLDGSRLHLTGYVGEQAERDALASTFGADTVARVEVRPPPICTAMTALELPFTSEEQPSVQLLSRKTTLRYSDSLAFEVVTPDFFAFLYVIYLQSDGSVVNLMPKRALIRAQHNPGTHLLFGDGREGRQTFTAAAPAGNEAIIVIAARSPIDALDEIEAPSDGQYWVDARRTRLMSQQEFLAILQDSMDDEFKGGRRQREISAAILHVTVVAS